MLLRFIDGTAKNNGQRLDNVHRTHLLLAKGKLALQKNSQIAAHGGARGGHVRGFDPSSRQGFFSYVFDVKRTH